MKTYLIENYGIIIQCCVCKKIKVIDENDNIFFKKMEVPGDKKISHTYCPDCFVLVMAEAKADIEVFKGESKL